MMADSSAVVVRWFCRMEIYGDVLGMVFGPLPRVEGGLGSRCIENSDCQVVYQHTNNDIIIIIMIMM